jgi:hypothetical protein
MPPVRETLEMLQGEARNFDTKNHVSYLSEALQCTLNTSDPVAALKLLDAMWGSPFASGGEPQETLNDIGRWLETRLYREPEATHQAIAWELGWLRRFAKTAVATATHARDPRPSRRDKPIQEFGSRIDRIEQRRAEAALAHRQLLLERAASPPPLPPPPPTQLPAAFQVEFVDFKDARQARQTARKRAKEGKPTKERWIGLRPIDPTLAALAVGLVSSVSLVDGFDALFDVNQNAFYVTALEERDGKKVVTAIALRPSSAQGDRIQEIRP